MTIDEPRFLVDQSLQRLGHWLRAAGYDTLLAESTKSEYYLLRQAINEGRLLLTGNTVTAGLRRAEGTVILLENDTLEEQAEELSAFISIDWQFKPFTRCITCNSVLPEVDNPAGRTTETADEQLSIFCPVCNQIVSPDHRQQHLHSRLIDWKQRFIR